MLGSGREAGGGLVGFDVREKIYKGRAVWVRKGKEGREVLNVYLVNPISGKSRAGGGFSKYILATLLFENSW